MTKKSSTQVKQSDWSLRHWLQLLFSFVVAASTIAYTYSTCQSVDQLKGANELTQDTLEQIRIANENQRKSLRPYIVIEDLKHSIGKEAIGTDDEFWVLQFRVINSGQLPAEPVQAWIYWDETDHPDIKGPTGESINFLLGPAGGSRMLARSIKRKEAEGILDNRKLFIHCVVHYNDPSDESYYTAISAECKYERGEFLGFHTVFMESDSLENE